MDTSYYFTIFIPTYNRAELLPRAFRSIEKQNFNNIDVLLVDDGSTDNTREVVDQWRCRVDFPVRYFWQENRGKARAYNAALDKLNGKFTVLLDSDDLLAPNALQILKKHWEDIPPDHRSKFAGVEGLCAEINNGKISGDRFPKDVMDSDYLETRMRFKVFGDKKNAIRSEVMRQYPYPTFENERDIRMSIIWNRMARKFRMRYINEVIQLIEYQADGLSSNVRHRQFNSPRSYRLAFMEQLNEDFKYCSVRQLFGFTRRYIRCSLHAGIGLIQQARDIDKKVMWLLALPSGVMGWLKDRLTHL